MKYTIGCVLAVRRHDHNNYGTSLQAYATIRVLQDAGYDVRIIRYNKHRGLIATVLALPEYLRAGGKTELLLRINRKLVSRFNHKFKTNNKIRNQAVEAFKEEIFEPLVDYYDGYPALKEGSKKYDICLVGSDQLWHPMGYASGFYNLKFVDENVPKLAYAASFGVSNIPEYQCEGTKDYLERFDWISVRETAGKKIVETLSNKKADFVCDPTMLLSKKQWQQFAEQSKKRIQKPYIFCYFLGKRPEIREEAAKLSKHTGLEIVFMRHVDEFIAMDDGFGNIAPYDVSPIDFVNLLEHAEYVLTDSFHGTIFSIMLECKFITFYRVQPNNTNSTHSRIDSLLNKFNLQERLFKFNRDIVEQAQADIDFSFTRKVYEEFQTSSKELLLMHINEACKKNHKNL